MSSLPIYDWKYRRIQRTFIFNHTYLQIEDGSTFSCRTWYLEFDSELHCLEPGLFDRIRSDHSEHSYSRSRAVYSSLLPMPISTKRRISLTTKVSYCEERCATTPQRRADYQPTHHLYPFHALFFKFLTQLIPHRLKKRRWVNGPGAIPRTKQKLKNIHMVDWVLIKDSAIWASNCLRTSFGMRLIQMNKTRCGLTVARLAKVYILFREGPSFYLKITHYFPFFLQMVIFSASRIFNFLISTVLKSLTRSCYLFLRLGNHFLSALPLNPSHSEERPPVI